MNKVIVIASLSLAGCASGDWSNTDTAYELAYVAAVAADAWSTSKIQYNDGATERQPLTRAIIGERPSTADTWQYFASLAVVHYLVSRSLPETLRRWWQVSGTAYHGYLALDNCNQGLCGRPGPMPPPACASFEWRSDTNVWRCTE